MYLVTTTDVAIFKCDEFEDAVSLADNLTGDSTNEVYVVDEVNLEVVYTARK